MSQCEKIIKIDSLYNTSHITNDDLIKVMETIEQLKDDDVIIGTFCYKTIKDYEIIRTCKISSISYYIESSNLGKEGLHFRLEILDKNKINQFIALSKLHSNNLLDYIDFCHSKIIFANK